MAIEGAVLERLIGWVTPARELDWDAVYAEQLPRVYNFFRYRVGEGPEAEDLTSVTFEKAWRGRHRYRRDLASFPTWLMTIARRVAIDRARALRRHAPLEEALSVAHGPTPEEVVEARSDAARLARLLAALPDREREVVALKYGAGWTHRAIGRLMGLTETNVGTILHRTVQELRAEWENSEGGR
jgi:RNA polymerase sigma-70 factor (ECF subfamily)